VPQALGQQALLSLRFELRLDLGEAGRLEGDGDGAGNGAQDVEVGGGEDAARQAVVEVEHTEGPLAQGQRRGNDAPQVVGDDALRAEHRPVAARAVDHRLAGRANRFDYRPAEVTRLGNRIPGSVASGDEPQVRAIDAEEEGA